MKEKLPKIIFYITLSIYPLLLIAALIAAVTGFTFLFSTSYGLDAFFDALLIYGLVLCVIPVIPICLIYQIAYLVFRRMGASKKVIKNFFIVFGSLVIMIAIGFICVAYSPQIEKKVQRRNAQKMIENAEVSIPYDTSVIDGGGILNLEGYSVCHIFLDYDSDKIGFLTSSPFDEYHSYKLKKTADVAATRQSFETKYWAQAVIPLPDGNGTIYTYCADNIYQYDNTIALILEMNDGTAYSLENVVKNDKDSFSVHTQLTASEYSVYYPSYTE